VRTFLQKYGYWLLCTAALTAAALLGILMDRSAPPAPIPEVSPFAQVRFSVPGEGAAAQVAVYEAEPGQCYVFLPAHADLDRITLLTNADVPVTLDGRPMTQDAPCRGLSPDTPYTLSVNGQETTLRFLQSRNVASLHINTASGNLDYIHADRNARESASIALFTPDGSLTCTDSRSTVRTRGNTTWAYEKKPYALTLSADRDLLEMGAATDWVLLANATDETNLHNKLVFDFAGQLDPQLSPECAFVDLYMNGNYRGLYLLTEKVEPGDSRLHINTDAGDFLCSIDFGFRWDILNNPFFTRQQRAVEISAPDFVTVSQSEQIKMLTDQMEEAILSGSCNSLNLDSWARKYLIDEVFGNIDADLTSSHFYYRDGTFYAGPIWDYDMTFGTSHRNNNPRTFIAKNARKASEYASPYYDALYRSEVFYNHMTALYREEFLPLLEQLIQTGIADLAQTISAASEMNSLRWKAHFLDLHSNGGVTPSTTASLTDYLTTRVAFLSSAWVEGIDYCTVQFETEPDSAYTNIAVPKGQVLQTAPVDLENTVWYIQGTQEIQDFSQPIRADMILTRSPATDSDQQPITTRDILTVLSLIAVMLAFAGLVVTDFIFQKHRKETRR